MSPPLLLVLLGPTGVGKTAVSLDVAEFYKIPVISADSRQFYREMKIGTAAPTDDELRRVKHYFVGNLALEDYYSASQYESDVMQLLTETLFPNSPLALMCGGSMMYIDAVCKGIDDIPTIDESLRQDLKTLYANEGIEPIKSRLKLLDPVFYRQVDLKNHKRVIHAVEICLMSGKPYSSLRTNTSKSRPFKIVKIGLERPREELYKRINSRVDKMMADGLLEEAHILYEKYADKDLNSLNTVGYKELFKYFAGEWSLDFAIEKIKQNTRIYSRKQMTWFRRDKEINWFDLTDIISSHHRALFAPFVSSR